MKLVIMGQDRCSLTRALVGEFVARNVEFLVLAEADCSLLQEFPKVSACTREQLIAHKGSCERLVYVVPGGLGAGLDPNTPGSQFLPETKALLKLVEAASINEFLQLVSLDSMTASKPSVLAESERKACLLLADSERKGNHNVLVAATRPPTDGNGDNRRSFAKLVGAAFKPTISISRLADFLTSPLASDAPVEICQSDNDTTNPVYAFCKRFTDLLTSLLVVILFWWLFGLIWLAIRLTTREPGLFVQERIGKDGSRFKLYKFKTMKTNTVQAGSHEVCPSAITPIGHFLRKTKLDELPQVVNILKNEMSLIGPRPCLPIQHDIIEMRRRHDVLDIKPGVSGYSQILGITMADADRIAAHDARYKAKRSVGFDTALAFRTLFFWL